MKLTLRSLLKGFLIAPFAAKAVTPMAHDGLLVTTDGRRIPLPVGKDFRITCYGGGGGGGCSTNGPGAILTGAGWVCANGKGGAANNTGSNNAGSGKAAIMVFSLVALLLLTGCIAPEKITGKIVSVNQRILGIDVAPSPSGTYHLKLGFSSTEYQIIPTATNEVYAAPFRAGIRVGHKLFTTDINDQLSSGHATTNAAFGESSVTSTNKATP